MITVNRFTLSNGLRVVHNHDSATAMVALDILYNVGSRDERPERTGMAHLFEHLMFGGSENVAEFDKALENAGGTNNAWTNSDFTNFYDIVPAHNAETAFWLESDRMKGLAFSDKALEVQRQVVCEEFKQVCLNQPYGDLQHYLNGLAYKEHPYRTPVIGKELSHIENVTQDEVRRFFYEPRRPTVTGRAPQTVIVKAYHMPGYSHPDYPACDIITDLLALGRASRFYRKLMLGTEMFTKADASITGSDEPGLLMLYGYLRDGVSVDEAEKALTDEAMSLIDNPPSDYELQRTLNRFESNFTFGSMNYVALASTLTLSEMRGEDVNSIIPRYRRLTSPDIARVASMILRPENSSTLIYKHR